FGNYAITLDGKNIGSLKGYQRTGTWDDEVYTSDTIKFGTAYFEKDTHTIDFTCLGKDSAAVEYHLGPDLLLLTPITSMALPKGVFTISKNDSVKSIINSPEVLNTFINVYPNPASNELTLGINFLDGITDGSLDISICDILGRQLRTASEIPIGICGGYVHFD